MKTLIVTLFTLIALQIQAQESYPKHHIYVPFVQLQENTSTWSFDLEPIVITGIGYERAINKRWAVQVEGTYKTGVASVSGIDASASGAMKEWNAKLGIVRKHQIKPAWTITFRAMGFWEKESVPRGIETFGNFNEPATSNWYSFVDYKGVEVGIGMEWNFYKDFKLYMQTAIQLGMNTTDQYLFDVSKRQVLNVPMIEGLGLKYQF